MTDRIRTLSVTLDKDYRTDDLEPIREAIGMIKGVAIVDKGPIVTGTEHMARQVARWELIEKMVTLLRNDRP